MDPTRDDALFGPAPGDEAPDFDGLIACTIALMTAWADPCPRAALEPARLRHVLARKVASNLFFLQHHPAARPELRQSIGQARAHWVVLGQPERAPTTAPDSALPHWLPVH